MKTKTISKKNLLLGIGVALFMSLLISVGMFTSAYANESLNNAKNSTDSNGWKTWTLDPNTTLLDVQHPYMDQGDYNRILGNPYAGDYMWNKDNGIKGPQLQITRDLIGSTLSVIYTSWCPGLFNDVDYKFTVVAKNHQGKEEARFVAGGDDYDSDAPCSEDIWQTDCKSGDKHIAFDPANYDGVFYLEVVKVDD